MKSVLKILVAVTMTLAFAPHGKSQPSLNYSAKPFLVPAEGQNVPIGYLGNSIRALLDARFTAIKNFKAKGEYETSAQYGERVAAFLRRPILGSIYTASPVAFAMTNVSFQYNADLQILFVRIGCGAYAYKQSSGDASGEIDLDNVALTLSRSISKVKKNGKTRLGISFSYLEETGSDYSILIPASETITPDKYIVIGLKMSPEDARKHRASMRVLLAGSFDSMEIAMERSNASLDSPHETAIIHKYIVLGNINFVVFDAKTGNVFPQHITAWGFAADLEACKDRLNDETMEQCQSRLHGALPE